MFPLRVRSYYSLMQGTSSPESLCKRAKALGYRGLALTDRDNLYGLWNFIKSCRTHKLQPIIGAEISEAKSTQVVTCLVQNKEGYSNLCQLITRRHTKEDFALETDVPPLARGLVLLVSDRGLIDTYLNFNLFVVADLGHKPDSKGRSLRLHAKDKNIPAVATSNSDLATKEERELHRLIRAIAEGRCLDMHGPPEGEKGANYFRSQREYQKRFAIWPEVLGASDKLAGCCTFSAPDSGVVMPPWRNEGYSDATVALREKAYNGARERYGDDLGEEVVERLEYELKIIEQMGFSSYFLVVRDIVHPRQKDGTRKNAGFVGVVPGQHPLLPIA